MLAVVVAGCWGEKDIWREVVKMHRKDT